MEFGTLEGSTIAETLTIRSTLFKHICEALEIGYGRIRGMLHRSKAEMAKLVPTGKELHQFKVQASFGTTASHLAFAPERLECTP